LGDATLLPYDSERTWPGNRDQVADPEGMLPFLGRVNLT